MIKFSGMEYDNPKDLIKQLVQITDEAMYLKYSNWKRYRKKLRNEKHAVMVEMSEAPLYSSNYMAKKLTAILGYVSNNIPEVTIMGVGDEDDEAAEALQNLIDWMFEEQNIDYKTRVLELMREVIITGVGYVKVMLNKKTDEKEIDIRWEVIPAEQVKVDPLCNGNIDNARWIIHQINNVSIDELKYVYNKKIREDGYDDIVDIYKPQEKENYNSESGTTTVWECYLKDYSTEKYEEVDEEGNITKTESRLYPKWRLIIVCEGYDKPLYDGNLPPGYNDIPIIMANTEPNAQTIYTVSVMEKIEPLQDLADKLDRQITKNISLIVNRQRLLDVNCGLKKEDIRNEPGYVYEMMDINGLRWDEPTQLSSDIFKYRQDVRDGINDISGITEVAEGNPTGGVEAYSAIVRLQDSSTSTINIMLSRIAQALSRAVRMTISLFKEYAPPEFMIELMNGSVIKIVDEYPQVLEIPNMEGQLDSIDIEYADTSHKIAWKALNGVDIVLEEIKEEKDLIVNADNELPSSKAQRARLMLDLFKMGVIDAEALLEGLKLPGRKRILRRMEEKQRAIQEAQMAAQMGAMPGNEMGIPQGEEPVKLMESASVPTLPPLQPDRTQEKI